jgi:spore germination cell wall hydrolase CwlJ-like protein
MAIYVYANYEKLKDITHGALFYHADYVNPRWRGLEVTTKIGRHIFYKERERI